MHASSRSHYLHSRVFPGHRSHPQCDTTPRALQVVVFEALAAMSAKAALDLAYHYAIGSHGLMALTSMVTASALQSALRKILPFFLSD